MLTTPSPTFPIERLQAALDAAHVGVWEMTLPERRPLWSGQCKVLFGFAPDQDITFEQVLAAVHPQDRPRLQQTVAQACNPAGTGRYENEYRVLEPGYHGRTRWIRSVGSAVFNPERTAAVLLQGFCIDITESKHTAAQAQQQQQQFEFLAESIPDMLWIARPDGSITYFNKRWSEYTGITLEEGLEWGWGPAMHPDDLSATIAALNRSLQSGQPYEKEFRMKSRTGEYRWFMGRGLPLLDAEGHILQWFGTCTDIHEQHLLREQLQAREAQFRAISNTIPQLAWMTEASGAIVWYNQRWYDYTGTTLEQMQGWGWEKVHHPEHYQRVYQRWAQALETGEPWQDVFPLRGRTGEYRWFLSQAAPLRDAAGNITRWFGTNTDITNLHELPYANNLQAL
ncbi:PAS domain-containing protein [Hymenobacter latericus]|uniref:PAS domain-containing protein n=1 Tax=Hymenobacter sp. YIM 151858-1 TaxID=2987688 RepID=UPI0022268D18|nr:PAS domain-containing protein [Hymenobacter sp. YIM 151858-1]UYZ57859.1 PAS domain-containing protein [Hymenobacter sp. YIM 151858-1]